MIADDHQVVRAGLRLLLEAETGFEVVAEAGDVADDRARVTAYHPQVLILDLNMPGGSSLPSIPRIRESAPDTQIVVLTMQNEPAFAREALRAGAIGYVLKEAADAELCRRCGSPPTGAPTSTPSSARGSPPSAPRRPVRPTICRRASSRCCKLIALGHTNAEIASKLYLSVRTVESHRAHIQQKLGRASRADLVAVRARARSARALRPIAGGPPRARDLVALGVQLGRLRHRQRCVGRRARATRRSAAAWRPAHCAGR